MRYLLLLALLAAACVPSSYNPNLYVVQADAAATQAAAQAYLRATEQARQQQARQATLSAAETAGAAEAEIALLEAQLGATRQAFEQQQAAAAATQAERDYQAGRAALRATEQAAAYQTQTAYPPTATIIAITQAAVFLRATAEVAAIARDQAMATMAYLVGLVLVAMLIGLSAIATLAVVRRANTTVYHMPAGFLILDPLSRPGQSALHFLPVTNPERPTAARIVKVTPPLDLNAAPPPVDTHAALVRHLIRDAMNVVGEEAATLPGWRQLPGWNSDRWQRAVRWLEARGLIVAEEGRGTYLAEGVPDLTELLWQVENGAEAT